MRALGRSFAPLIATFVAATWCGYASAQPPLPVVPAPDPSVPATSVTPSALPAEVLPPVDVGATGGNGLSSEKPKDFEKLAGSAYKGVFYENDFSYLDDPAYDGWHLGEATKRLELWPGVNADFGGQYRARYHHEQNMRGLGLTGRDDDFLLHRTRLYGDVRLGESVRIYGEVRDAVSEFENYPPRSTEEDRLDILNAFADVLVADSCSGELWARVGRQELMYGSQRVISPLDWSNNRRAFDGAKLFWRGEDWNVDAFWTQPLITHADRRDVGDASQDFAGVYGSYRGAEGKTFDFYYLFYDEDNASEPFAFNTLGTFSKGKHGDWLYEFEGDYQFGRRSGHDHSEWAATMGLGRKLGEASWAPTAWVYYDYASEFYNHQFPLGHRYLGFVDFYGRRNLHDANLLVTSDVTSRLQLLAWYHQFFLANLDNGPFGVTMQPFNPGVPAGNANLGSEIDLLASYMLTPRINVLAGYSHYFTGDYYRTTPGVPTSADADFVYTQFQIDF